MTFGQRVAQKRKELGLSQEGLGERLGVSRQAIYKWESDAALPEIDKLITLSKLFAVPVGWLLGVEEAPPQAGAPEELTEAQLNMVQEIADRYLSAQPKPQKSVWDKWSVRILFALCGIMVVLLVGNHKKMEEMDQQYANLTNFIGEVNYSVDRQINSITRRVEDILKNQNTLTAEWSAELASTDLAANTAAFDVRVVPRTYLKGMTAVFIARSGEDTVELPVTEAEVDGAFSGQIVCPLSDSINLSVVLISEDKRETQWLDDFYDLYAGTFPDLYLETSFWAGERDGVLPANNGTYPPTTVINLDTGDQNLTGMDIRVGLFQDRKLVCWYEKGTEGEEPAWYRRQEVILEPEHEYCEAAVYTDEYGRRRVYSGTGIMIYETDDPASAEAAAVAPYVDGLEGWEF